MRGQNASGDNIYNKLDQALRGGYRFLFTSHRVPALLTSLAVYAIVILVFGPYLRVSSNYFVLLPIAFASLVFGIPGGLLSGAVGLPINLLLFQVIGHPEFTPESKLIAELSGLFVGGILGYMSDYFGKMEAEITRRKRVEDELLKSLEERQLLLAELNHRVRNNLNIIKSLIQLQEKRSRHKEVREAADVLVRRIMAISFVHEQLGIGPSNADVDARGYIQGLARNLLEGLNTVGATLVCELPKKPCVISRESATPLGLIVSEIVTNALKHAFSGPESGTRVVLSITLSIHEPSRDSTHIRLVVADNGSGFDPEATSEGLGLRLVNVLCEQIHASYSFQTEHGTRFEMSFPVRTKKEAPESASF